MTVAVATLVPTGIAVAADSRTIAYDDHGRPIVATDNASKVVVVNPSSAGIMAGLALITGLPVAEHVERFKKTDAANACGPALVIALAEYLRAPLEAQSRANPTLPRETWTLEFAIGTYMEGQPALFRSSLSAPDFEPSCEAIAGGVMPPGYVAIGDVTTIWRLLYARDSRINTSRLDAQTMSALRALETKVNFYTMALQDAVDFSQFLVQTTIAMHRFTAAPSLVGGDIDIAVVTDGDTRFLRQKQISAK